MRPYLLHSAELGHGLVVPTDNDPFAFGGAVEIFGQLCLDLENIDLRHDHIFVQLNGPCQSKALSRLIDRIIMAHGDETRLCR